jgi:hypothetical protein
MSEMRRFCGSDYDTHKRKSSLLEVFKLRLGLCGRYFFDKNIKCHPYVMENRECSAIVNMFMDGSELITTEMVEKSLPDFDRPYPL